MPRPTREDVAFEKAQVIASIIESDDYKVKKGGMTQRVYHALFKLPLPVLRDLRTLLIFKEQDRIELDRKVQLILARQEL